MLFAILEIARTRINWEETERRMKEAGFTDEEIKKFREKPVEEAIKFLDKGRLVPITLKGPHSSVDLKFETKPYKPFFPISLSSRHPKKSRTFRC